VARRRGLFNRLGPLQAAEGASGGIIRGIELARQLRGDAASQASGAREAQHQQFEDVLGLEKAKAGTDVPVGVGKDGTPIYKHAAGISPGAVDYLSKLAGSTMPQEAPPPPGTELPAAGKVMAEPHSAAPKPGTTTVTFDSATGLFTYPDGHTSPNPPTGNAKVFQPKSPSFLDRVSGWFGSGKSQPAPETKVVGGKTYTKVNGEWHE
jgi:hypothetical protein